MIIDLTKPLDPSLVPFSSGTYRDPPFKLSEWSSIPNQGFRVSRLSMGTQTGTHIDAPAHFVEGGATLDALSPEILIGRYFLLDLPLVCSNAEITRRLDAYRQEKILFLRAREGSEERLSPETANRIVALPALVIVLSGNIVLHHADPFAFNRLVAAVGKYLVEDLDESAAWKIPPTGELIALPLRLSRVSGSPCRVVIRID